MAFLAADVAGAGAFAGDSAVYVENRSDHPVKAVLPGSRPVTIPSGDTPVPLPDGDAEHGVGVTVRLWWTSDPRQLCQIYVPWDRTVSVTGSNEIRCLGR
ncbi:MAG: hypothetical protein JNM75_05610 [Rhodospirillales bacterium]|nr:hypothetical protein [Rhodospirillales bacterium]